MSWVKDLASVLGIPAGAATLAVAMYAACAAAENAARPEALQDIGRLLADPSWSRSVRPSALIDRVFRWTFGEKHLSRKCILRSLTATVLMLLLLSGLPFLARLQTEIRFIADHLDPSVPDAAKDFPGLLDLLKANDVRSLSVTEMVSPYLAATLVADYLALWKTRTLLASLSPTLGGGWWKLAIDVAASLLISILSVLLAMFTMNILVFRSAPELGPFLEFQLSGLWTSLVSQPFETGFALTDDGTSTQVSDFLLNDLSVFSTLFTSVWMFSVLASATLLKMLAPLQRVSAWFFDVDNHPVKAIGIVSGALIMAVSLVWTFLLHLI